MRFMIEEHKYALVKDVMSTPIFFVNTHETAQEAIKKMKQEQVNKALIFNPQDQAIGYTDIWKLGLLEPTRKIEDALERNELIYSEISTVTQDKDLKQVMPELLKKGILAVVDDRDVKIGVITPDDIRKVRSLGLRL
jgi:predicted transcriptional regulator